MKITSQCPSCQKTLSVGAEHAGKKIRCPVCKAIVHLPEGRSTADSGSSSRSAGRSQSSGRRRPAERPPAEREEPAQRPRRRRRKPESDSQPRRSSRSRTRPRPQRDPDDLWSQPISSQGAAIPESAYESYGLPPRKKKKRDEDDDPYRSPSGERGSGSSTGGMNPLFLCFIVCAGSGLLAILGVVIGLASGDSLNVLAFPAVAIGLLLNVGGSLKILGNAFEEGMVCALLYLFVPFYPLIFLLSRWDVNGTPFLISLFGLVTFIAGFAGLAGLGGALG